MLLAEGGAQRDDEDEDEDGQADSDPNFFLARFLLIFNRLLCVFLCTLYVVGRLLDVVFDPVDHLPLSLHLHGQILEHVVKVFDAPLQLQDLVVSGLDLIQRLLRGFGVDQDLCSTCLSGDSWTTGASVFRVTSMKGCTKPAGVFTLSTTWGSRRI